MAETKTYFKRLYYSDIFFSAANFSLWKCTPSDTQILRMKRADLKKKKNKGLNGLEQSRVLFSVHSSVIVESPAVH